MAYYDAPLVLSSAQVVSSSTTSTNIYDVTGAGAGNAPNQVFGYADVGFDIGAGDSNNRPTARTLVTTDGTGAGTISVALQYAPNNANNPGTYVTLSQSGAFVGTDLDAGNFIDLPIPPVALNEPGAATPRFYRFAYTVTGTAAAAFTSFIGMNLPSINEAVTYGPNYESVTV